MTSTLTPHHKRWRVLPPPPPEYLARFPELGPVLGQILYHRGLHDGPAIEAFLRGTTRVRNPYTLKGLPEAVTRIRHGLRRAEKMAVYGDFDADGVTSTTLLVQALRAAGAQVEPYIPHRVDEGYGLNNHALTHLRERGCTLVITVDCGIRSLHEAEHARQIGIDLIITDHHHPGPQLPAAYAIINPRQPNCRYGYTGLAGVGVAYRLAQGVLRAVGYGERRSTNDLEESDLLDLVALGTVADIVPLTAENRDLVRQGLSQLQATRRVGLRALMESAGVMPDQVDTTAIGFRLAPRLNAAGRLKSAMLAYQLLSSQEVAEAQQLAAQLSALNQQRQTLTEQTVMQARRQIEADPGNGYLLMAEGDTFLHGVVGLAAGKLADEYYRPVVVIERGPQFSHGSARSIPEFHVTAALDQVAHLLERHGGHAAAAGLTVRTDRLPALRSALQEVAAAALADQALQPTLQIDAEVRLSDVDWGLHGLLQQLEPCGEENPAPTLLARNCQVVEARTVGSDGAHLKLKLSDGWTAREAIAFRQGAWLSRLRNRIDIAFNLEVNTYNGNRSLQLNVLDLAVASDAHPTYQPSLLPDHSA